MMYVAVNGTTNEYAIAIRGTDVKDFLDLYEDLRTRQLTPYPYAAPSAGDQGFADSFNTMFDAAATPPRAYRYYNTITSCRTPGRR